MKLSILIFFVIFQLISQESFKEFSDKQSESIEAYEQDFNEFVTQEDIDFQDYLDRESADYQVYVSKIARIWGDKVTSTAKNWVVYDKTRKNRIKMDFENENATIQIANASSKKSAIKKAKKLMKAIQTQRSNDGKSIVETNISKEPEEKINSKRIERKEIVVKGKTKTIYQIKLPFKHSAFNDRVKPIIPIVKKYAKKYNLRPEMILGIIHTESAFSPRAKSWANAYGLMQLVPKYGGLESYSFVYNKQWKPTPSYLYNPDKNVELGCAYIYLLKTKYYPKLNTDLKKDYIAICAYNTGPSNVALAFNTKKNIKLATIQINKISESSLYQHLRKNLPYKETRHYIKRVLEKEKLYIKQ